MSKQIFIIYHKEDNDGVFSAALAAKYLESLGSNDITFFGTSYAELSEIAKDCHYVKNLAKKFDSVVMLDISFNEMKMMKQLQETFGENFIWIDHHGVIINKIAEKDIHIAGIQDTRTSAIGLCFEYFYDPFRTYFDEWPNLLKMLADYDSWNLKTSYGTHRVYLVNTGITTITDLNINNVSAMIDNLFSINHDKDNKEWLVDVDKENDEHFVNTAYEKGKTIYEYNKRYWASLIDNAEKDWTVGPDNRKAAMLVFAGPTSSRLFDSLKYTDIKHGLVFRRAPKNRWTVSLYNISPDYDKEFHCGKYIAKVYKGGGHAGACGATISNSKFMKLLRIKHF